MKSLIAVAALVAGFQVIAAETGAPAKQQPDVQARAKMERKLGGFLVKPGSQKGLVLVLDAQKTVAPDKTAAMVKRLADISLINFKYESADPSVAADGDWTGLLKRKSATALVVIVSDDKTAPLLVSPDEQWAVVNAKRLELGLNEDGKKRFLADRVLKQVLRGIALMSGSACRFRQSPGSAYGILDLDNRGDMLPMDQVQQLSDYLGRLGATHVKRTSYRKACQEGWAPQPTNDIQKAVWDEVHELPSKPLKLKK